MVITMKNNPEKDYRGFYITEQPPFFPAGARISPLAGEINFLTMKIELQQGKKCKLWKSFVSACLGCVGHK